MMKEAKKKLTPAELSAIRAENGRRGALTRMARGTCRGGRPAGSTTSPELLVEPASTISVAESDREILRRYAFLKKQTLKGAFHLLMQQIAPQLKNV